LADRPDGVACGLGVSGRRWQRLSPILPACFLVVLGAVGLQAARAQDQEAAAPPANPLDPVRELVALSSDNLEVIDGWIAARINELKNATGPEVTAAGTAFHQAFARERQNPANSAEFGRRFAARAGAAFATEFGLAEPLSKEAAWPLARVLLDLDSFDTLDAVNAGLAHPVQAVRYLCAKTCSGLRNRISTDLNLTRSMITLLKDAAVKEPNAVVLSALYGAMGYTEHTEESARAMAEVFAARVQKRQTGQIKVADRAELAAWEFLHQARARIPDPEKALLARELAGFLTLDVDRYAVAKGDEQLTIEERIEVGEDLLERLVGRGGGGNVRKAMKAGGTSVDLDMKLELVNWVGAEGAEGALNKSPWNVPVGGLPAEQ